MSVLVFLAIAVVVLTVMGVAASLMGADSRDPLEDTYQGHWIGRIM